jgi:hypothetical protein
MATEYVAEGTLVGRASGCAPTLTRIRSVAVRGSKAVDFYCHRVNVDLQLSIPQFSTSWRARGATMIAPRRSAA